MAGHERELFIPQPREVQSLAYRDIDRTPHVVIRQTDLLLGLFYQGMVFHPEPAREYINDYSMKYIDTAIKGSAALYDTEDVRRDIDVEAQESANHALIIMTWMNQLVTSSLIPMGFSRTMSLAGPTTQPEFLSRMHELQRGLQHIDRSFSKVNMQLEGDSSLFRVVNFFKTGAILPIKLSESEEKAVKMEHEKFNDFLGGLNFDFGDTDPADTNS